MVRVAALIVVVLAALPAVLLPAGTAVCAEELKDNIYVVRSGDTLSGIAGRLLDDPKRWPEILKANPQVRDGNMIFPGDTLTIPLPELEPIAISTGSEEAPSEPYEPLPVAPPEAEEVAAEPEPAEPADLLVERVKPLPTISQATYRAAGYITTDLPETSIVASLDSKKSLVEGDEVIIGTSAEEGTAFTVVRPTQQVYHPHTGEYLGWVVRILGWAEVNCRNDRTSRAILSDTVDAVHVGDLIVPFDPEDVLEDNILRGKQPKFCLTEGAGGYIVASQEVKRSLGEGDIVFLDQGRQSGVEPGDQFVIYRKTVPEGINVIGQVQILKVGERTSTAFVINSMRAIEVPDAVQAWVPTEDSSGS